MQEMPKFRSEPSGTVERQRFNVYGLDVWGHAPEDCKSSLGCKCVHDDEDGNEVHDPDGLGVECDAEFTINDRWKLGEIEIEVAGTKFNVGTPHEFVSYGASDERIVEALVDGAWLKESITLDHVEIDDPSCDGEDMIVRSKRNGKPILEVERVP